MYKLIALGVLLVMLVVLTVLKNNQQVCEFFATTFSRAWIFLFGNLFGILPFSMYELFLVCAILGAVTFLVFVVIFLCKRRWKKLVSTTLAVAIAVVSFVNIYTATASFSYNREPLPEEVYTEFTSDDFSYQDAVLLAERMVEQLNSDYRNTQHDENGNIVYPFSFNELSDILAEEYKRLDNDYFSPYTPRGKRIINKRIMSELHISGVFFAPFGEANVNGNENSLYLPLTLAHEMAHGKGVMKEYQADLVAMYVTITSENPYVRYGALAKLTDVALNMILKFPTVNDLNQHPREKYQELVTKMEKGVDVEQLNYSKFYGQFTLLKDMGNFLNDIYLKLQKQEGGTSSYVKPGEVVIDPNKPLDDAGKPVVKIVRFSGTQNLLINLFKQGLL